MDDVEHEGVQENAQNQKNYFNHASCCLARSSSESPNLYFLENIPDLRLALRNCWPVSRTGNTKFLPESKSSICVAINL